MARSPLNREPVDDSGASDVTEAATQGGVAQQRLERIRKPGRRTPLDQGPDAPIHHLRDASDIWGHHGKAAGHRFKQGQRDPFRATREHHRVRPGVLGTHVRNRSEDGDAVGQPGCTDMTAHRLDHWPSEHPGGHGHAPFAQRRDGIDEQQGVLLRGQSGGKEEGWRRLRVRGRRGGDISFCVDPRVDHADSPRVDTVEAQALRESGRTDAERREDGRIQAGHVSGKAPTIRLLAVKMRDQGRVRPGCDDLRGQIKSQPRVHHLNDVVAVFGDQRQEKRRVKTRRKEVRQVPYACARGLRPRQPFIAGRLGHDEVAVDRLVGMDQQVEHGLIGPADPEMRDDVEHAQIVRPAARPPVVHGIHAPDDVSRGHVCWHLAVRVRIPERGMMAAVSEPRFQRFDARVIPTRFACGAAIDAIVVDPDADLTVLIGEAERSSADDVLFVRACDRGHDALTDILDVFGVRFATVPGLAAIAGVSSDDPFSFTFPRLDARRSHTAPWPAALAVRITDLLTVAPQLPPAPDPLVTLAECFTRVQAGIEWRLLPLTARPPAPRCRPDAAAPMVRGPLRGRLRTGLGAPSLGESHPAWVPLERMIGAGGRRRTVCRGTPPGDGEFHERTLCMVHRAPFPDAIRLFASEDGCGVHPLEAGPAAIELGYLHDTGLPGGVHLSVFHDPSSADDFIGLSDEVFPGCHRSRPLGWALEFPEGAGALEPGAPVDRVELRPRDGDWVAEPPAIDAQPGRSDPPILLHRDWAPDRIALYRALRAGRAELTIDPFGEAASDLRLLGYLLAESAPTHGALVVDGRGDVRVGPAGAPPMDGDGFLGYLDLPVGSSPVDPVTPDPGARVGRRQGLRIRMGAARRRLPRRRPRGTLIAAPWFSIGGGDNFLLALIRLLRERGEPVSAVLTFDRASSPVDNRAAFAPYLDRIVCLPEDRPAVPVGRAFGEVLREVNAKRVILCGAAQLYPHLPGIKAAFPWVTIIDQLFNDFGHIAANTRYSRSIDLTVCAYRRLRERLIAQGREPSRTALAYIGIDTDAFIPASDRERRAAKEALGLNPDREVWGYLGRISEEKCLSNLVHAVERIAGVHDAQILIQGDGPARSAIERMVDAGAYEVALRPFADDVSGALKALDVYVLPSRVEGIPLGVMEAMAAGVLTVATAVGGLPELIDPGVNGYLVAPQTPDGLALGLLAAARTPEWVRAEMAQAARMRVATQMSTRSMNLRYAELLGLDA